MWAHTASRGFDLLGRKVAQHDGAALGLVISQIKATCGKAAHCSPETQALAEDLSIIVEQLRVVTEMLTTHPDRARALANSSAYLEAFGHIVLAWMWLEQVVAGDGREGDFYDGKRQTARYFYRWELPRADVQLELLHAVDDTVLRMAETWF